MTILNVGFAKVSEMIDEVLNRADKKPMMIEEFEIRKRNNDEILAITKGLLSDDIFQAHFVYGLFQKKAFDLNPVDGELSIVLESGERHVFKNQEMKDYVAKNFETWNRLQDIRLKNLLGYSELINKKREFLKAGQMDKYEESLRAKSKWEETHEKMQTLYQFIQEQIEHVSVLFSESIAEELSQKLDNIKDIKTYLSGKAA